MSDPLQEVNGWLSVRLRSAPSALSALISDALENVSAKSRTPLAVFQEAANGLLRQTFDQQDSSDAVCLLAADALITYMCEYCSEREPESLPNLL